MTPARGPANRIGLIDTEYSWRDIQLERKLNLIKKSVTCGKKKRSCRKKRWPEFDVNAIVGLVELSRKIAADAALALLYASI